MLISNKAFYSRMVWVLRFLLGLILFDLGLSLIQGSLSDLFPNHELALASLGLILLFVFLRFSFFSYEDEYEIIHIDTRSLVFGFLESNKHRHYEFAKIILSDYSIQKGFMKYELTLTVNSSSGDKKLRRFDLFFLNDEKRAYVENSLKKVLESNKSS